MVYSKENLDRYRGEIDVVHKMFDLYCSKDELEFNIGKEEFKKIQEDISKVHHTFITIKRLITDRERKIK